MGIKIFIAVVLLCEAASSVFGYIEHPGPRFPPTKGEVWPKPQNQEYDLIKFKVIPEKLTFQIIGENCETLKSAVSRYEHMIFVQGSKLNRARTNEIDSDGSLWVVYVNLRQPCEERPSLNMDEAYVLNVTKDGSAVLTSNSIWGMLRALETFSQLVYMDDPLTKDMSINVTNVSDFPRFSHRGILLDTSRHYVSVLNILKILDGMTYNKLNVFHWHIVDDQSFPYQSSKYPNLSIKGAYNPQLIYKREDIDRIVEYARLRGIRVVSEYDTPGHTRSWGVAYPELLTECYGKDGKPNGDLGPVDPSKSIVYTFMNDLLTEVVSVFPDKYVHLGGDEVDFDCWESNPHITEYMHQHNLSTYQELEEVYIQRIVDMVNVLKAKSIVWQEVFLNHVNLPKDTVVQAWTGDQKWLLNNITSKGLPALLSSCWYLDHLSSGGDWEKFYDCDPHDFPGDENQKKLVFGGEACMWGEVIDNSNVLTRIFPRASATAEKLWSAPNAGSVNTVKNRLEEQYCRMNKRGYPAQPPSGPGFCI